MIKKINNNWYINRIYFKKSLENNPWLQKKKQNVCARQQNKQANKFFCEIFVECMHFVSVLHIVFASPFFLKEVDENYPKKIFPKAVEDNHRDVLEIHRKSISYFINWNWWLWASSTCFYFSHNVLTQRFKPQ